MHGLILVLFLALLSSRAEADDSWMLHDDSQVGRVDITIDQADLDWAYANVWSDSMHVCTVRFRNALLDTVMTPVGFRLRGNTSRTSAKKSFKLKFDEYLDGLEFFDEDALNLNGEHNDPAIARSKIAWDLMQRAGMRASRASHSEVWINGNFYGLYVSVEHIDKEWLRKRFADSSGNLWKCLWPADLNWLGSDPEAYKLLVNDRRVYELKTNEELDDYGALQRLVRVLTQTPPAALRDSLESVLAIEDVLEVMAVDVLLGNWDDYRFLRNNYYLYHDPSSDLMHFIPYDYDNNMGIDWFNVPWATLDPYAWPANDGDGRPLSAALLSIPAYRDLYTHFLERGQQQLLAGFDWSAYTDALRTLLTPSASADNWRTLDYGFTVQDFQQSWSLGHYENQHVKRGLLEFLDLRSQSLPGQLNWVNGGPVLWQGELVSSGIDSLQASVLAFSAAGLDSLWLLPSLNGQELSPIPLLASPTGGQELSADDGWSTRFPRPGTGTLSWRLRALDQAGHTRDWPVGAPRTLLLEDPAADSLRIVEFMASNSSTISDGQGDFDDWLELVNGSQHTLQLAGVALSDSPSQPLRYLLPDTLLGPGERLLVWCDNDTQDPGLHAGFALSANGESLLLSLPGGRLLQRLDFGASQTDLSWQLPCDAGLEQADDPGAWLTAADPTPGTSNQCLTVSDLRITRLANSLRLDWSPSGGTLWRVERYPAAPWLGGAQTVAIVSQPFWVDEQALGDNQPVGCYTVRIITQP
ncbi:MAG: CotH kinase family protein [Candidatus Delongbacteria bacterium]|nr:CotH kinase family protein [Candidatus Delongbacteria bacterium]